MRRPSGLLSEDLQVFFEKIFVNEKTLEPSRRKPSGLLEGDLWIFYAKTFWFSMSRHFGLLRENFWSFVRIYFCILWENVWYSVFHENTSGSQWENLRVIYEKIFRFSMRIPWEILLKDLHFWYISKISSVIELRREFLWKIFCFLEAIRRNSFDGLL